MDIITLITLAALLNVVASDNLTSTQCDQPMHQLCKSSQQAKDCNVITECNAMISGDYVGYHHTKHREKLYRASKRIFNEGCQMCRYFRDDMVIYFKKNPLNSKPMYSGICKEMFEAKHITSMNECVLIMNIIQSNVRSRLIKALDNLICEENPLCYS